MLVIVYLASKVEAFFSRTEQVENVNSIRTDLFEEDTAYMNETGMTLVLFSRGYIPPGIGAWKARRVSKPEGAIFGEEWQEIELGGCEVIKDVLRDYFIKRVGEELFEQTYSISLCLTDGWLRGDYS